MKVLGGEEKKDITDNNNQSSNRQLLYQVLNMSQLNLAAKIIQWI